MFNFRFFIKFIWKFTNLMVKAYTQVCPIVFILIDLMCLLVISVSAKRFFFVEKNMHGVGSG